MSLSLQELDNLLNESFKSNETTELNVPVKLNESNINYELLLFTDGAHERVKKRSSFGIYIQCQYKLSDLYKYNETKIIKKIAKDHIIYNTTNNNISYHSLFKNTINEKCKYLNCTYFGIFTNNKDDIGEFCKNHKNDLMIQTMSFYTYDPTNIRAEGLAIVYALLYLKLILVDNVKKENLLDKLNSFQFEDSNFKFTEYISPKDLNNFKFYQIITDSEFWINVITKWSNNWIKQNTILEKKNIDIIYYLNKLLIILIQNNIIILFKFIRGHSDKNNKDDKFTIYQMGNIIADKLANIAKENNTNQIKISFE